MSNLIDVGQISAAHGIKGWVKIHSQTEPVDNIFNYQPWQLKTRHGVKPIEVIDWRPQGKGFVAQIKGVDNRNQAEALCPVTISVEKSLLPELEQDEFYRHQLEGCRVISHFGDKPVDFGCVKRIMPTGANDVLIVTADEQSMDDLERLIPYVPEQFIKDVDLQSNTIIVDWDPEF